MGIAPRVLIEGASSLTSGRQTVSSAGTAVKLVSTSSTCRGVFICAEEDNTGKVVLGDSSVVAALASRKGYALNPDDPVYIEIDDPSKVYLDAVSDGDGVTYMAVN